MLDYIRDGQEIYRNSFAIIRAEANLERITPGLARPFGKLQTVDGLDHAEGVNHTYREFLQIGRNSVEVGLGANDREGVAIDLLTVADVIKHQGGSVSERRARPRPLQ